MSKAKLVSVLDKKIRMEDEEARKIEKNFRNGTGSNFKDFISEYLEKRK